MTATPSAKEFEPVVTQMLSEGATYQDIAVILGKSRCAVSGIVRRLGLTGKTVSGTARPRGWSARKARLLLPKAPDPIGPIGDFPGRGACRHPVHDDGAPMQFCGHPGYPYCEFHHAINHVGKAAA